MRVLSSNNELAVIDTNLSDYETLQQAAVDSGMEVVLLSDGGIDALAVQLQSFTDIDALHLFSHGSTGQLVINGDTLNTATLDTYHEALADIASVLSEEANLFLYGCEVASNKAGQEFVTELSAITGAEVFASDDITGFGGDWSLEYSTAGSSVVTPFSKSVIQDYQHTLATLELGDLVVINQDTDFDTFRLLALNDITAGTVIKITDSGIDNTGALTANSVNEGTITWTVGTSITAGETFEFSITPGSPAAVSLLEVADNVDRSGEIATTGWDSYGLSSLGDQIIIYQGSDISPTFISGFHNSSNDATHTSAGDWQTPGSTNVSSSLSHLPTGLTNNINALAFSTFDDAEFAISQTTHQDNLAYNGPTTAADKATWMSRIFDRTNWIGNQSNNQVGSISETPGNAGAEVSVITNSAPALGGTPADDTATEDSATAIDLSAYNISDADGDTITLTLAVDRGTISSVDGNVTTGGVTIANSGTASMTLQGTAANLNTYLDDTSKITYTTAANDTTTAVLTVTPNDGTENGSADTVNISINAVNDNPTATGAPGSITVTEDVASNVDLSTVTFADLDGDSLTVTLTAAAGTFAANSGGSVTIGGSGTGTLTLAGTAANINTFLDTATNIKYTTASNSNAGTSFTIKANDGTVNPTLGTVSIGIVPVNDAPVFSNLDGDSFTYTEGDGQVVIDQGTAVTLSDVDSADFSGGSFLAVFTSGSDAAEDVLSLDTSGSVSLGGTSNGDNVLVGGVVVGTLGANIAAGSSLLISLNASATAARLQTLSQAVTYENTDTDNPTTGARNVRITVTDGDTGTSANQDITITVAGDNDAPAISNLDGDSFTYVTGTGAAVIDQSIAATLADVDSTDFNGGALTVTITSGEDATEDRLSVDGSVTLGVRRPVVLLALAVLLSVLWAITLRLVMISLSILTPMPLWLVCRR